ncbi:MAG TPA: hypothetical protein VK673_15540 [Chthoniobacterales bacterium]|jgi:hypothetical protein|nr:hypothetical protein [Verrucomicrobiota bacterium]HTD16596.1 hypothetical protein [Chthoniobacterales bacterium]
MKTLFIILMLAAVSARANDSLSPNRQYAIRAQNVITLIDAKSQQPLLMLDHDTNGLVKVEIAWAPDSTKVGIILSAPRGSAVVGAWFDGSTWHKTIELDADSAGFTQRAEAECGGRLVSEGRSFCAWETATALRVQGTMKFVSGRECNYQYLLQFEPAATVHLDVGGFEEGALVPKDFRLE